MPDNQGWIKLYRNLLTKPIWLNSSPTHKTILIALLLMANHATAEWEWKGQKYTVKPGQTITSLEKILITCGKGVTTQNVRSAIKRFEKLGFLTNESTKQNRLITIVNWGLYQSDELRTNKATNSQLTNSQQTTNKQVTTNKNDKNKENDKNEEKDKNTSSTPAFTQNSKYQDVEEGQNTNSTFVPPENDVQSRKQLFDFWEQNGFGSIPPIIFENIDKYVDDFVEIGATTTDAYDLITYALKEAVYANARNWNWVRATLNNYLSKQIVSVDAAKANKSQWRQKKQPVTEMDARTKHEMDVRAQLKAMGKESSGLPF